MMAKYLQSTLCGLRFAVCRGYSTSARWPVFVAFGVQWFGFEAPGFERAGCYKNRMEDGL